MELIFSDGASATVCPWLIFVRLASYVGGASVSDDNCDCFAGVRAGSTPPIACLMGCKLACVSVCWMRVRFGKVWTFVPCLIEVRFGYKSFYCGVACFMEVSLTSLVLLLDWMVCFPYERPLSCVVLSWLLLLLVVSVGNGLTSAYREELVSNSLTSCTVRVLLART